MLLSIGAAVATAAFPAVVHARARNFFERHHLPLGLQLYTVREPTREDMGGVLRRVAAAGYRTTELAGYLGHTPAEIRRLHDVARLRCVSAHVAAEVGSPQEPGLNGDLGRLAEHMHTIGVKHVVVPAFPIPADVRLTAQQNEGYAFDARVARAVTAEHWKARAAKLNGFGQKLHSYGLRVGYHNHSFEFTRMGAVNGLDILLAETDPDFVTFELDVGWAFAAGQDPAAVLRSNPGRFRMIHIKDMLNRYVDGDAAAPRTTEIGAGLIDWHVVLNAAYENGARDFFVEQEPPFARPALQAVASSARFLLGNGL